MASSAQTKAPPAESSAWLYAPRLLCPLCRRGEAVIESSSASAVRCPSCEFVFENAGGVVRALPPKRRDYYRQFQKEYLTVRHAEGRGAADADYYLALPFQDISGKLSEQWVMRAASYRYFERRVLPEIAAEVSNGLRVLDVGAGAGWLSYRLALAGHRPVAVDLLDDPLDGLGAARHYFAALPLPFLTIQAEFDTLPFADQQFDLVVFNASFHYAVDYRRTLREVRRCLRWPGRVVIMDSPIYKHFEHGERMREERLDRFEKLYGFRSDSVPSMEYLDLDMLRQWERELNIRWIAHRPWYGWRWHARPWKARLQRRRPPSRFWILAGRWKRG